MPSTPFRRRCYSLPPVFPSRLPLCPPSPDRACRISLCTDQQFSSPSFFGAQWPDKTVAEALTLAANMGGAHEPRTTNSPDTWSPVICSLFLCPSSSSLASSTSQGTQTLRTSTQPLTTSASPTSSPTRSTPQPPTTQSQTTAPVSETSSATLSTTGNDRSSDTETPSVTYNDPSPQSIDSATPSSSGTTSASEKSSPVANVADSTSQTDSDRTPTLTTKLETSVTVMVSSYTIITTGLSGSPTSVIETTTISSTEMIPSVFTLGGGTESVPTPSPSSLNVTTQGSARHSETGKVVGGIVAGLAILLLLVLGLLCYRRTRRRRAARESVWFSPSRAGCAMFSGLLNRPASSGSSLFYTAEGEFDDITRANNRVSSTRRYGAASPAMVSSTALLVSLPTPSAEMGAARTNPFTDPTRQAYGEPLAPAILVESPTDHAPLPNPFQDPAPLLGGGNVPAWEVPLPSAHNSIMVHGPEDATRATSVFSDRSDEVEPVVAL
ncbi:hypothetical protein DAEQUDRAFT_459900 [Daedalea quercina L-15889]|uniref:Uncharacterized protein n=1 Tax=Daedalea quercina L-15889 TaxID=1314783 RepID=A0A165TCG1_9APHY|nr:hypothetical protein DAEQUDRAFT_459900 [Daedalea quercina L-15889]